MYLRVVGGPVVDAHVLDFHRPEIQLPRTPGVLVAAAGAAVIERRYEETIFALVRDDRRGYTSDEIERVVPARRLHLAVAPDHWGRQALQLRRARP